MIIVFSGVDGAGKSTQIERLERALVAAGRRPRRLWSRGGYTPLFNGLKSLLRRTSRGTAVPAAGPSAERTARLQRPWVRRLWLTLAILDLIWLYGVRLRWWRRRGQTVLCDRYLADTALDFKLNFPDEEVARWPLWRALARLTPQPDAAFLLLLPVEESLRRSREKNEPFPDSPAVLSSRLAVYQEQAENGRWHVLDGRRSIDDIAAEVAVRVATAAGATPAPVVA